MSTVWGVLTYWGVWTVDGCTTFLFIGLCYLVKRSPLFQFWSLFINKFVWSPMYWIVLNSFISPCYYITIKTTQMLDSPYAIFITNKGRFIRYNIFKASALWADVIYVSKCPFCKQFGFWGILGSSGNHTSQWFRGLWSKGVLLILTNFAFWMIFFL